jgi:hypothetical protein
MVNAYSIIYKIVNNSFSYYLPANIESARCAVLALSSSISRRNEAEVRHGRQEGCIAPAREIAIAAAASRQ